jgi:hypothetical protein
MSQLSTALTNVIFEHAIFLEVVDNIFDNIKTKLKILN